MVARDSVTHPRNTTWQRCIAGVIEVQSAEDMLGTIPSTSGRILELVIKKQHQGQGIGSMLVKRMEDYFPLKGRDSV